MSEEIASFECLQLLKTSFPSSINPQELGVRVVELSSVLGGWWLEYRQRQKLIIFINFEILLKWSKATLGPSQLVGNKKSP